MESYSSRSGKQSGVIAYELESDSISVQFKGGAIYKYTYSSAGSNAVEVMKNLAINQAGLSTYIAQFKPSFYSKG